MGYYQKFVAKFKTDTEYHGAEAYAAAYVIADALFIRSFRRSFRTGTSVRHAIECQTSDFFSNLLHLRTVHATENLSPRF